ncbi:hypothetical protein OIDMADRAFT_58550 [Oidiodendron maius Zn]|uniref:Uncharacterized protein n=1 Tax=Oidiodendron maius (strain Zn) TaxID=913774 RepID=A0A0C3GLL0_OIDMZ|nr:hypothetical protein OIDMADRAFT_58550 [Oidiodendron maius Zn]
MMAQIQQAANADKTRCLSISDYDKELDLRDAEELENWIMLYGWEKETNTDHEANQRNAEVVRSLQASAASAT